MDYYHRVAFWRKHEWYEGALTFGSAPDTALDASSVEATHLDSCHDSSESPVSVAPPRPQVSEKEDVVSLEDDGQDASYPYEPEKTLIRTLCDFMQTPYGIPDREMQELKENALLETLSATFQYLIEHTYQMGDLQSTLLLSSVKIITHHEKGFKIAIDSFFQLMDKLECRHAFVLPDREREWIDIEDIEGSGRRAAECCEFYLLFLIASRMYPAGQKLGSIKMDPMPLLNRIFDTHGAFLDCFGRFEFIQRLPAVCRKRGIAVLVTRKALEQYFPVELVEMVTDEVYEINKVKELLKLVVERYSSEGLVGDEGHWLQDTFSKLGMDWTLAPEY